MTDTYDLLIIGGGAAGMAAAISAHKNGLKRILLIERSDTLGGVLTRCIHHGFGRIRFHEDLTGIEYAERFISYLSKLPVEVCLNTAVTKLGNDRTAVLSSFGLLRKISFSYCVLATGCRERSIGTQLLSGSRPSGIYTAGQAQEMLNVKHLDIGDNIVILGSGNVGQIMARQFSIVGKSVITVVEQNASLGGLAENRRECIEKYKIPVMLNSTVTEIFGDKRITGVTVYDRSVGSSSYVRCDTLVTAMGLIPDRQLMSGFSTAPDWMIVCGNAESVHDIVDSVTAQSEALINRLFTKGSHSLA